jgi:hypothetical protein|tara:strand:+ start:321 stop:506 length:186 start_codon:yes stop_codon:yes gene_type:complete
MVTTAGEAAQLIMILLKYMPRRRAINMLEDMNFDVGQHTENESLKESLKMVLKFLGKSNEV